ncbi:MAG: ABC transporter transmembrane domain-containing protein [Candidatus Limnocylindrales bacterium]
MFAHVQKMPVAFFTRTKTGALVSRLNNDVIGAQRAFSDTLSGVVTNIVALVLTLVVMLRLSWQITVLALVLLPVFVLPARRMGRRLAAMEREAADHNATMTTQMTERFSAPGATLVKLFGRPDDEEAEFTARARRVRDIGVRSAVYQWVFVTALLLVSALALALVYGLGGYLALRGILDTGDVVSLALLLARLYAPLDRAGQRPARGDDRAGQLRAGLRGAGPGAADRRTRASVADPRRPRRPAVRRRPASATPRVGGVPRLPGGGGDPGHPRRRGSPARGVASPPRRGGWWPSSGPPVPGSRRWRR